MKIQRFIFLFFTMIFFSYTYASDDPLADSRAIVKSGNIRFTILTPELIRIEYNSVGIFEDRASFSVINRKLPVPSFTQWENNSYLYIETEKLYLVYKKNSSPFEGEKSLTIKLKDPVFGKDSDDNNVWYPYKDDSKHNLRGTKRTLDSYDKGDLRLEFGLISRSGWAVIDETNPYISQASVTRASGGVEGSYLSGGSNYEEGNGSVSLLFDDAVKGIDWCGFRKVENQIDWYFLGYGHNYKKALEDFTKISGKIPMPPLYAFGYWYSKYKKYKSEDYKNIINTIKKNEIPHDIIVMDMGWHSGKSGGSGDATQGWTGWSWDIKVIENPAELLRFFKENNLKVSLNLHPAYGISPQENNFTAFSDAYNKSRNHIKWELKNKDFYPAFFENILRPHEKIGVDFWWLDWQQHPYNEGGLSNTFWLNHVFYNDMKINKKGTARPLIFHRWGGLGSHRYPVGFSGDTYAYWNTLSKMPYFTATASNVGYAYWSHDIGGHQVHSVNKHIGKDSDLYLRWIQFGIFSPVLRTHGGNGDYIIRDIWAPEYQDNFKFMREAMYLRYSLAPYLYTQSRKTYDTGLSICYPLYYNHPEEEKAYLHSEEYMFGDNILVRPIADAPGGKKVKVNHVETWLPEGNKWFEAMSGTLLDGNSYRSQNFLLSEIPYYYKAGSVIPTYPPSIRHLKERPSHLILKFVPGENGKGSLYEDENDNDNYQEGKFATTAFRQFISGNQATYTIDPIQGNFTGMPTKRSYDLELLSILPPVSVNVNGVSYLYSKTAEPGSWSYDGKRLTVVIHIPEFSTNTKLEAKLTFHDNPEKFRSLLNENVAKFRRLEESIVSMEKEGLQITTLYRERSSLYNKFENNATYIVSELENLDFNLSQAFESLLQSNSSKKDIIYEWINLITKYNGSTVYLIGSATSANWDCNNGSAMLTYDKTINKYTWEGELKSGEFKFLKSLGSFAESNTIYANKNSEYLVTGYPHKISLSYKGDNKFIVAESARYKLTMDLKNETLIINKVNGNRPIYLVGDATSAAWNAWNAIEIKPSTDASNIYEWTGYLNMGEFKFITEKGNWSTSIVAYMTNEPIISGETHAFTIYGDDHKFSIKKSGFYTIRLDIGKQSMTVTEKTDGPVYMTGDATPYGWSNSNSSSEMNYNASTKLYTWTGTLNPGQFKFIRSLGSWIPGLFATQHEYIIPGYSHTLSNVSSNDFKFKIKEKGEYEITLDLTNMKLNVNKKPQNGPIYLVGAATPYGWDNAPGKAQEMTLSSGGSAKYSWSGYLKKGDFKLVTALNTWLDVSINATRPNEPVEVGNNYTLLAYGANDYKFYINNPGTYIVKIDLAERILNVESTTQSLKRTQSLEEMSIDSDFKIIGETGFIEVFVNDNVQVNQGILVDLFGNIVDVVNNKKGRFQMGSNLQAGVYIIKLIYDNSNINTQKVLVK